MSTPNDPRRTLMLAAIALSLLSGAVLITLVIRGGSAGPQPAQASGPDPTIFEPLIDPSAATSGATGGTDLFIQIADRNDPDRLAMELRAQQMDPIGRDQYDVQSPRAWVFMRNGASVYITSASGTLLLPDRAREPEEGTLTGGVVIRRYAPMDRRADPDVDQPEATFRSETLSFDLTLGEVWTPDRVLVTSTAGELAGADLQMRINEPLERVDLFRLRRGEYLRIYRGTDAGGETEVVSGAQTSTPSSDPITTGAESPAPAGTAMAESEGSASAVATAPAESAAEQDDLIETFYRSVFNDDVVLLERGRTIKGDRLELWARLVDNQLAPDAIGAPRQASDDRAAREGDSEGQSDDQAGTSNAVAMPGPEGAGDGEAVAQAEVGGEAPGGPGSPADSLAAEQDGDGADIGDDILLTWTGVAEIRPTLDRPAELERDEVAARFTASQSGRVLLEDPVAGANASTGVLDYYASRREVVMTSSGMHGVEMVSRGGDVAQFGRFELSLETGIGYAPGAGLVKNRDGSGAVTWNEQADLIFAVDERGITGVLEEAMCSGAVRARRDAATIESDFLRTRFVPVDGGELRLAQLVAQGGVRVSDGRIAGGTCNRLMVAFDPLDPSENPQPTGLVASGDARFSDADDRINADIIDASLRPADDGEGVTISRLRTMGSTSITRAEDDLEVSGGSVLMHERSQSVEITGPGAVAQRAGVRITAEGPNDRIELDGTGRNALVIGAGTFSRGTRNPDGSAGSITAQWTRSMAFDDLAGTLRCEGDVRAVHAPDPTRRDVVIGDIVDATFDPFDPDTDGEAPEEDDDQRRVRTFLARAGGGTPVATVESARYEPEANAIEDPEQEPVLAKAMRINGPLVSLDQERGLIEVPGAGDLLVADLRQDLPPDRQALARFEWTDSFVHDRNTGRATMIGSVRTAHRRRPTDPITLIEADRLFAVLLDPQRDGTQAPQGTLPGAEAQLRSARAEGNVSLRSGSREALAGSLDYDASAGTANIQGRTGGFARLIDTDRTGVPTRAGRIFWDLNNDRVNILDAGPYRGGR